MSVRERFLKFVSVKPDEQSPQSPQPPWYSEKVREFLDVMGVTIEDRRKPNVPVWHPSQFDRDVSASENAHQRRMSNDRRIPTNTDSLM